MSPITVLLAAHAPHCRQRRFRRDANPHLLLPSSVLDSLGCSNRITILILVACIQAAEAAKRKMASCTASTGLRLSGASASPRLVRPENCKNMTAAADVADRRPPDLTGGAAVNGCKRSVGTEHTDRGPRRLR